MNGIDISRYQPSIDLSVVPCDFVIIKATQNTTFVSPTFKKQIADAEKAGKLIGVYHYAASGGVIREAEHFLKTVNDYIGRVILVLDWESDMNKNWGNHKYAVDFLRYVREKTGITPFIYMSKSVCRAYSWDNSFPLWVAQYKDRKPVYGYQTAPWTDKKGYGAWNAPSIFQYTSQGYLPGYAKNLDLDLCYISREEWCDFAAGKAVKPIQAPLPVLRYGNKNEYVRDWQRFLIAKGYDLGKSGTDGIFGIKTLNAVKEWQKANEHICGYPDGIIGAKTWKSYNL